MSPCNRLLLISTRIDWHTVENRCPRVGVLVNRCAQSNKAEDGVCLRGDGNFRCESQKRIEYG